ncbi:hypothetical protein SNE40_003824 [Patella caerulea]|uniref:Chitin-binding type-2 domain-containing protein n=1 Tax=Patella caerulea TaxID=87958 RepID=A0AAN8KJ28_PATCE
MHTLAILSCLAIGLFHQAVGQVEGGVCSEVNFFLNIVDPNNCSGYFKCVDGAYESYRCPAGLVFSTETVACDWPTPGGCQPTTSLPANSLLDIPADVCSIQPCAADRDYLLPNYNTAGNSDFYVCKGGKLFEQRCGTSPGTEEFLFYNVLRSSCEKQRSRDSLY